MSITDNIARVREQIAAAEAAAGREAGSVTLMLAAKHQPIENLIEAAQAGATAFGHNIVQQLQQAAPQLAQAAASGTIPPVFNSMIGPLQSNKLRAAMDNAQRIDTVDSLKMAKRIARRQLARQEEGLAEGPYRILLQVNAAGAATQSGCAPDQLLDLANAVSEISELRIEGLMTIGANTPDTAKVHASFALTRELSEQMRQLPGLADAAVLSMGMSGDFAIAIEEGSSLVRVGTAVFGPRPTR